MSPQELLQSAALRSALLAWIGRTDLRAPLESDKVGLGPIAQALASRDFDDLLLVANYDAREIAA